MNADEAPEQARGKDERKPGETGRLPDEYDRRGVKLPSRTRVGGIITPQ